MEGGTQWAVPRGWWPSPMTDQAGQATPMPIRPTPLRAQPLSAALHIIPAPCLIIQLNNFLA
jgi:hypothetical protein